MLAHSPGPRNNPDTCCAWRDRVALCAAWWGRAALRSRASPTACPHLFRASLLLSGWCSSAGWVAPDPAGLFLTRAGGSGLPGTVHDMRGRPRGAGQPARRWPSRVYAVGEEPDPRFTFANERTFLAWIRTALALVAGGVALEAFVVGPADLVRTAMAAVLTASGAVCAGTSYVRWMTAERALRQDQPLPAPALAPWLAVGAALVGVLALVLVLGER